MEGNLGRVFDDVLIDVLLVFYASQAIFYFLMILFD
jgi:hypothetical protein